MTRKTESWACACPCPLRETWRGRSSTPRVASTGGRARKSRTLDRLDRRPEGREGRRRGIRSSFELALSESLARPGLRAGEHWSLRRKDLRRIPDRRPQGAVGRLVGDAEARGEA